MPRETCASCDKPLGNTERLCHDCGGENYRAGPSYNGLISYLLGGGI